MSKEKVLSFSASGFTLPQEEVVELRKSNKSLIIGIPKEILLSFIIPKEILFYF